jgi:hypothetical protein
MIRNSFSLILAVLIAFYSERKEPNLNSAVKSANKNSPIAPQKGVFELQGQSEINYYSQEPIHMEMRNVTFSVEYLDRNHELDDYIIRKTQLTERIRDREEDDSRITLDIFNIADSSVIRTVTKEADKIDIYTNFLRTTRYGCCGAEDYCELIDIWQDISFLSYNNKYYTIEIPNSGIWFYFGYLTNARDESQLMHGELRFALVRRTKSGSISSIECENKSRLFFKAKTKEVFDKLLPFSPEITLLRSGEKDELLDHQDYQELRLWSYNHSKELRGIDFPALRLTFENNVTVKIELPLKNGLLYGDAAPERIIYIDE